MQAGSVGGAEDSRGGEGDLQEGEPQAETPKIRGSPRTELESPF